MAWFSGGSSAEIVSAPKVYGFDTGFVCYHRGWNELRSEDLGLLWEHLVLNEMHSHLQSRAIHYWRSKQGAEVDFVLTPRGKPPIAIECKWSADGFESRRLRAFRARHPKGVNFVVATDVEERVTKRFGKVWVRFVSLEGLIEELTLAETRRSRSSVKDPGPSQEA